ncbi:MmgE/PrpD family protein [Nocardioides zeae]|uniref:2-methylcitrate dehydratase PrpD n=1 Tax=Nocardioides zeae TaxID=1457234 RepID=A0AAJ1U4G3_9ACTN|nr:MmgE/PrpD family protein [Nocardioides zeae]MDQ1105705.1 2-methylcitrate dehydratase PrpD [Nocardioides zeae]
MGQTTETEQGAAAQARPAATERLAAMVAGVTAEDLPPAVLDSVRRCLLDYIGCSLYGSTLPWSAAVRAVALAEGATGPALVVGTSATGSPTAAAMANGTAAHAFEIDDLHEAGCLHPGAVVFPAAMALLPHSDEADGATFLAAVVAGYEVGARLGSVLGIAHFLRGFHPQGTIGAVAAAAAAARALGLDVTRTRHALAIAASQGAGLMGAQEEGMVKRFHSGWAAQSGVYAALLAAQGLEGSHDILEAEFGGFVASLRGDVVQWDALEPAADGSWEIDRVGFKAYASCAVIHPALALVTELLRAHDLGRDDVASIDIDVPTDAFVHCGFETQTFDAVSAQMSFSFAVAVLVAHGETGGAAFTPERLDDPLVHAVAARVRVRPDEDFDARGEAFRFSTRVTLGTHDGRRLVTESVHRPGSPQLPLSTAQLVAKFRELALAVPEVDAERVAACVLEGDANRLLDVTRLLQVGGAA